MNVIVYVNTKTDQKKSNCITPEQRTTAKYWVKNVNFDSIEYLPSSKLAHEFLAV